uniref:Uncharacterized protein n=1 Tax=Tetraselmis sp. GSL018 TaxID=582737 RepID=A0A061QUR9_9CHLO
MLFSRCYFFGKSSPFGFWLPPNKASLFLTFGNLRLLRVSFFLVRESKGCQDKHL